MHLIENNNREGHCSCKKVNGEYALLGFHCIFVSIFLENLLEGSTAHPLISPRMHIWIHQLGTEIFYSQNSLLSTYKFLTILTKWKAKIKVSLILILKQFLFNLWNEYGIWNRVLWKIGKKQQPTQLRCLNVFFLAMYFTLLKRHLQTINNFDKRICTIK